MAMHVASALGLGRVTGARYSEAKSTADPHGLLSSPIKPSSFSTIRPSPVCTG